MLSEEFFPSLKNKISQTVEWVGERDLPWFDAGWPYNGARLQKYDGLEIDLETVNPVAGFTGSKIRQGCYRYPSVQKLLAIIDGDWFVLSNKAHTRQFIPYLDGESLDDYVEIPPTFMLIGKEGAIVEGSFPYLDLDGNTQQIKFQGDNTLRKVVELLNDWGWMYSPGQPGLFNRFPKLNSMLGYLVERKILYSDEGIPNPLSEVSRSIGPDGRKPPYSQTERLKESAHGPEIPKDRAGELQRACDENPLTMDGKTWMQRKSISTGFNYKMDSLRTSASSGEKFASCTGGVDRGGRLWKSNPEKFWDVWYLVSTVEKNPRQ